MTVGDVVHLELHTPDLSAAREFLHATAGWRGREVRADDEAYVTLPAGISAGVVQCGTSTALWVPYVEVEDVDSWTARAVSLGAQVLLEPRDGPTGRRAVVRSSTAGDLAFWCST